ncbi:hypothetical protein [Terriglobus roseus]|uniref:Uncharacterized protein n=1 Tax=Terriglobus roseus TaxID=392734 RepID=A0A1G7PUP5_9BACT|nr:hypothetical protein [Terriglobus roseus]SDF89964.1 hypothetical protein SAMN05444167_3634 [Terriglobus roseus]
MRFTLTAALFCTIGITAAAQTVPMPEVTLEPHDGKTHFYLGEPIRLDVVYRNNSGTPMMLNGTDYGDLSDKVSITPAEGWIQWRGQSGHDYASVQTLTSHAERVPIRVNDGYVFRKPGHYTIRVTADRVSGGTMGKSTTIPPTLTNGVEIDVDEMPKGMEADIVRQVQNEVANAPAGVMGQRIRQAAFARLAALQGDDALTEKVRLIVAEDEDFRSFMPVAMATTSNLPHQLELLQAAWRNPANPPRWDEPSAMDETRRLIANLPLQGWQMVVMPRKPTEAEQQLIAAHNRDMEDLLTSMPQRTGESRTTGAYYLLEFPGLTEAEKQQAHEYAVEEFPHMNNIMQGMLLQTAHPPLRDPRLIPALKATLDKTPADREPVIAALELTAGDEQKQILVHAICAPGYPLQLTSLAAWHGDRLQEVDTCLAEQLKSSPGNRGALWNAKAVLAARYATPPILPQIKAGWNANAQDGTMIAVLMRMAPAEAVTMLDHTTNPNSLPFYPAETIYNALHQPYPPQVLAWLRQHLTATSVMGEQRSLAYQLANHGEATDEALIEKRLTDLRKAWAPRASEVEATRDWRTEAGEARATERDLMSSLHNATVWKLSPDKLRALAAGCMSKECRRAANAHIDH